MKTKILLLFLLFLLNNSITRAKTFKDSLGIISGKITDQNEMPISFASIVIYRVKDTTTAIADIADSEGNFIIKKVPFGKYFLTITRIGANKYVSDTFSLSEENPNKTFNQIKLIFKPVSLQTVTIISKEKRLVETIPGGYKFNASADLIGKNGDAIDMLKQVPGVSSDNDNNIILRGGSPTILIDGKEIKLSGVALTNYLKSIQGSNISDIEIITAPTAKYPATGEAGIIDIKLKKNNSKGFNTMLGLGGNTQFGGVQYGALNIISGKWNFSIDYNANYGEGKSVSNSTILNKYETDSNYRTIQNSKSKLYNNWEFANASLGYTPDSTLTLGADFNFGRFAFLNNTYLNSNIYTRDNIFDNSFNQDSKQHSRNMYNMYDVTMLKKMRKKGEELSGYFNVADYRNLNFLNFQRSFNTSEGQAALNQNNNTNLKYAFYTLKLDYTLPINNKSKIEAGLKDDYSNVNNDYVSDTLDHDSNKWIADNSISNNFLFNDNTMGFYVSYSRSNEKWNYQLGVRYENYWDKFHESDSSHKYTFFKNNLFPNLYSQYKFNPKEYISLSLGERVQRPGYGSLNPFINNSNYDYYSTGNPFLSPAITYHAEFQYSKYWHGYSQFLMISAGYSYITHIIGQLLLDDSMFSKPYYTYVNYQNSNRYTLNVTGQNKITEWWSINSDFNARYSNFNLASNYNIRNLSAPVFVFSGNFSNNFKFWKNANLQLSGQYLSAYNNFQNKVYPVGLASIAFEKAITKEWTLNAGFQDIFHTQRNKNLTNSDDFYILTTSKTNSRYAIIRLTYRFGKRFEETKKINIESNGRF